MIEEVKISKKSGREPFANNYHDKNVTVMDFWSWAHSDLIGNAERGKLAEYIVALSLDVTEGTRTEWDSFDILSNDGIKIEVKSSAYIQSWYQNDYSDIQFGIQPTQAWDMKNNTYDSTKKRQADIYVFCLHKEKNPEILNPLDLLQWEFYVLNTKILNDNVPLQKSIKLSRLKKLGAILCDFKNLNTVIHCKYRETE